MSTKRKINMPEGEGNFPLFPEGEARFQITNWEYAKDRTTGLPNEDVVVVTCESITEPTLGKTLLYRVNLTGDFLWLTKLFLKCIGEQHTGEIDVDPEAWIGRRFTGEVKHTHSKDGKTYANVKQLIYKDEDKDYVTEVKKVTTPEEIEWGN